MTTATKFLLVTRDLSDTEASAFLYVPGRPEPVAVASRSGASVTQACGRAQQAVLAGHEIVTVRVGDDGEIIEDSKGAQFARRGKLVEVEFVSDSLRGPVFEKGLWAEARRRREAGLVAALKEGGATAALALVAEEALDAQRRAAEGLYGAAVELRDRMAKLVARIELEGLDVRVNGLGEVQGAGATVDRECARLDMAGNQVRLAQNLAQRSWCEHVRPETGGECGVCRPRGEKGGAS